MNLQHDHLVSGTRAESILDYTARVMSPSPAPIYNLGTLPHDADYLDNDYPPAAVGDVAVICSRDEAVAKLYGGPGVDLQRTARRRKRINAALECVRQWHEGREG